MNVGQAIDSLFPLNTFPLQGDIEFNVSSAASITTVYGLLVNRYVTHMHRPNFNELNTIRDQALRAHLIRVNRGNFLLVSMFIAPIVATYISTVSQKLAGNAITVKLFFPPKDDTTPSGGENFLLPILISPILKAKKIFPFLGENCNSLSLASRTGNNCNILTKNLATKASPEGNNSSNGDKLPINGNNNTNASPNSANSPSPLKGRKIAGDNNLIRQPRNRLIKILKGLLKFIILLIILYLNYKLQIFNYLNKIMFSDNRLIHTLVIYILMLAISYLLVFNCIAIIILAIKKKNDDIKIDTSKIKPAFMRSVINAWLCVVNAKDNKIDLDNLNYEYKFMLKCTIIALFIGLPTLLIYGL